MHTFFAPKKVFVHLTSPDRLWPILKEGFVPSKVPCVRVLGDRNDLTESDLYGIYVEEFPFCFDASSWLASGILPVALRVEIPENLDCLMYANDNCVHDRFIYGREKCEMEKSLVTQARNVFEKYGSTVLAVPNGLNSQNWKITGMQSFHKCLSKGYLSQKSYFSIRQKDEYFKLAVRSKMRHMFYLPMNHPLVQLEKSMALRLCEQVPFVPFNEENVNAVMDITFDPLTLDSDWDTELWLEYASAGGVAGVAAMKRMQKNPKYCLAAEYEPSMNSPTIYATNPKRNNKKGQEKRIR